MQLRTLFQFHKGTIRTQSVVPTVDSLSKFQFHKGTIRTSRAIKDAGIPCDFNSIKVRLEPLRPRLPRWRRKFQFHKGTIRTLHQGRHHHQGTDFNSIKVRLERGMSKGGIQFDPNFNSIKVRLELEPVQQFCPCVQEFQFHKGTIRTWCLSPFWTSRSISIP